MSFAYLFASFVIGACFAAQPAINGAAAKILGSAFPVAILSAGITMAASAVIMMLQRSTPALETIAHLPWWFVIGGLIGVLVVGGGATIVPVTGAAVFFVCMIAGELVGSVVLDRVGAFGLPIQEISLMRIAGIFLTFGGVLLVRYG